MLTYSLGGNYFGLCQKLNKLLLTLNRKLLVILVEIFFSFVKVEVCLAHYVNLNQGWCFICHSFGPKFH